MPQPPTLQTDHRADIQGLRGVAVALVVAYHAGLGFAGGFVGVDAFFVVSGYVITAMLLREQRATGRIDFARFWRRRFWRLVPALALVVACTIVASTLLLSPEGSQQVAAKTGIGAMLLSANAVIAHTSGGYFEAPAHANPLLNTWSLSVEEQFYLGFAFLLAAAWGWPRRGGGGGCSSSSSDSRGATRRHGRAALLATAVVGAVSFALALAGLSLAGLQPFAGLRALTPSGGDMPAAVAALLGFYSPLTRAWEFAAGSALALWLGGRDRGTAAAPLGALAATALGMAGALALIGSALFMSAGTPFPGPWTLVPVAGTAALIVAGIGAGGSNGASGAIGASGGSTRRRGGGHLTTRVLAARPLTTLGDWSYSIYLWHWPVLVLARPWMPADGTPAASWLALLLALGLAVAAYHFVEQPLRSLGMAKRRGAAGGCDRRPRPAPDTAPTTAPNTAPNTAPVALAAAVIALPLALASALHVGAQTWFGDDALGSARAALARRPTGLDDHGCLRRAPVEAKDLAACRWHAGAPGEPIYLVGDSNAQQFSDAVIAAAAALHRPVVTLTTAGCPFVDAWLRLDGDPGFAGECRAAFTSLLAWLRRQPAGSVLVASVDRYWHDPRYAIGLDGPPAAPARPHHDNAAALNEALVRAVRALQSAGHAVTLIQTIPQFTAGEHPMIDARCSGLQVLARDCEVPFGVMPRAFADRQQAASRRGLALAAARTGAAIADFRDFFCDGRLCTTRRPDGADLYMADGYHLNRTGSARLAGEFLRVLGARHTAAARPAAPVHR